jgi:hypothetical protein
MLAGVLVSAIFTSKNTESNETTTEGTDSIAGIATAEIPRSNSNQSFIPDDSDEVVLIDYEDYDPDAYVVLDSDLWPRSYPKLSKYDQETLLDMTLDPEVTEIMSDTYNLLRVKDFLPSVPGIASLEYLNQRLESLRKYLDQLQNDQRELVVYRYKELLNVPQKIVKAAKKKFANSKIQLLAARCNSAGSDMLEVMKETVDFYKESINVIRTKFTLEESANLTEQLGKETEISPIQDSRKALKAFDLRLTNYEKHQPAKETTGKDTENQEELKSEEKVDSSEKVVEMECARESVDEPEKQQPEMTESNNTFSDFALCDMAFNYVSAFLKRETFRKAYPTSEIYPDQLAERAHEVLQSHRQALENLSRFTLDDKKFAIEANLWSKSVQMAIELMDAYNEDSKCCDKETESKIRKRYIELGTKTKEHLRKGKASFSNK